MSATPRYRAILPSERQRSTLLERLAGGEINASEYTLRDEHRAEWGADEERTDPLTRCQHGRVALAVISTTLGGEDRYCLSEMDVIRDLVAQLGPAGRGHGTGREDFLRYWSGGPGDATLVDCECACECGWYGRFDEASTAGHIFRCPRCVRADHPNVMRTVG